MDSSDFTLNLVLWSPFVIAAGVLYWGIRLKLKRDGSRFYIAVLSVGAVMLSLYALFVYALFVYALFVYALLVYALLVYALYNGPA